LSHHDDHLVGLNTATLAMIVLPVRRAVGRMML
jgi:hypothetical protein